MDTIPKLHDSTTTQPNEKNNNYYSPDVVNRILEEGVAYFKHHGEENITDRLADKYYEDGNLYFKSHKYKLSTICFQQGLMLDFKNIELRVNMWINLSNVYYFLKEYGPSLIAAEGALKLMPRYEIAVVRAINCCVNMKDFNKSLYYSNIYLRNIPESKKIEMEKRLIMKIEEQRILKEINKRKLYIDGQKPGDIIGDINILNTVLHDQTPRVNLTDNQRLVWPVLFWCPEDDASIFVPAFHEDATFYEQLKAIFSERPSFDAEGKYNTDTINIYSDMSVNSTTKVLKRVFPGWTLSKVLTVYRCPIKEGLPTFILVTLGGKYENETLEDYAE